MKEKASSLLDVLAEKLNYACLSDLRVLHWSGKELQRALNDIPAQSHSVHEWAEACRYLGAEVSEALPAEALRAALLDYLGQHSSEAPAEI